MIKVDAIVSSVNRMGVFADVGPLPVFVSNHVRDMLLDMRSAHALKSSSHLILNGTLMPHHRNTQTMVTRSSKRAHIYVLSLLV